MPFLANIKHCPKFLEYALLSQTWPVTLRIQEPVLSGWTVLPDSKETKLGSSYKEASPSAGKNTGVVLVPCCSWNCPSSYFRWCGYFWGPWVSFVMIDGFSVRVTKISWGLVFHQLTACISVFDQFLTQWNGHIIKKT